MPQRFQKNRTFFSKMYQSFRKNGIAFFPGIWYDTTYMLEVYAHSILG